MLIGSAGDNRARLSLLKARRAAIAQHTAVDISLFILVTAVSMVRDIHHVQKINYSALVKRCKVSLSRLFG